ncbi:MAG: hypothetical protein HZR80_20160 [Candidatus Heimdallarchaeota archaeon]
MTNEKEIDYLIKQLDGDSETCQSATSKLMNIGEKADKALPALKHALKKQTYDYTLAALISAIGIIGGEKEVDIITNILKNNEEKNILRWTAAQALGNMEEKAVKAIPDIIAVMVTTGINNILRCDCAFALGKIGKKINSKEDFEKIVEVFYDVLNEKDKTITPPDSIEEKSFRANIALAFMKLVKSRDFSDLAKNKIEILEKKENNKEVKNYLKEALK